MKRRPGVERRRRRLADKKVKLEVEIGPQGGLLKNGSYFYGALRDEVLEVLGGIEKVKGELRGTKQEVWVTASNVNKIIASQLGNYFEYASYDALMKIISADPDVDKTKINFASVNAEGRKNSILALLSNFISQPRLNQFIQQANAQAHQGAVLFWNDYRKRFINNKGKIEQSIELEWLGGGGGIGDLKLIIGNVVWMIECKYYSAYTADTTGIHYFNLSDARDNFKMSFWKFLKQKGHPYWYSRTPSQKDTWYNNITKGGFWSWLKAEASDLGNDNAALLSYLLQKGQQYEVLKYWQSKGANVTTGGRGIITGVKYSASTQNPKITVDIDLDQVVSKLDVSIQKKQAQIEFFKKEKKKKTSIGSASLPTETLETIKNNSIDAKPSADGEGWTTHLAFVLQRDMLSPFPIQ